jgi:hypothetical protein
VLSPWDLARNRTMDKPNKLDRSSGGGRGGKRGALLGQAGVHAVASQLCLRGYVILHPEVDYGVDLMLDNGIRLQVKVAHITYQQSSLTNNTGARGGQTGSYFQSGAYGFNLRRGVWEKEGNRMSRKECRTYEGVADFFVLWGIDENRFWIVPTSVKNRVIWFGRADSVNGSNNATYTNALKQKRSEQFENRWDLLDVNSVVQSTVNQVLNLEEKV